VLLGLNQIAKLAVYCLNERTYVKIFDDPAYKTAFQRFRIIRPEIFEEYFACLQPPKTLDGQALDVGAGIGVQAEMLLDRLPVNWRLVALEPSVELAGVARIRLAKFDTRASVSERRLGELGDHQMFDVIWMSEVTHLLGNPSEWACQLAAVMHKGGRVLIRTSTHTQLVERDWYRFFPSALQCDLARHPDTESLTAALVHAGFDDIAIKPIDESRLISTDFLLSMMHNKAFSTLYYLNNEEFMKGIQMLQSDLAGRIDKKWHYEMSAYTATFIGGAF